MTNAFTDLANLLERRLGDARFPEPQTPHGFQITLPDRDDADTEFEEADGQLSFFYAIIYRDSRGNVSNRRISVRSIRPREGDYLLGCSCHERRAPRHFRSSRIQELIDVATGEVFDDPPAIQTQVETLFRHLVGDGDSTAVAMHRAAPGLAVLIFLSRCDGEMHPSELEVLTDFLDHLCEPPGVDVATAQHLLARLHPDVETYRRAIRRLRDDPDMLRRVGRYARRLIDADGVLTIPEQRFAEDLATVLRAL